MYAHLNPIDLLRPRKDLYTDTKIAGAIVKYIEDTIDGFL